MTTADIVLLIAETVIITAMVIICAITDKRTILEKNIELYRENERLKDELQDQKQNNALLKESFRCALKHAEEGDLHGATKLYETATKEEWK